jgi:hypothetical protein
MSLPHSHLRTLTIAVAVAGVLPAISLPGCDDSTRPSSQRKASRKWSPAEERVIGIATAHLRKRNRLPADYDIDLTRDEDQSWIVVIWSRPPTPGAHTTVLVSSKGAVSRVIPGK